MVNEPRFKRDDRVLISGDPFRRVANVVGLSPVWSRLGNEVYDIVFLDFPERSYPYETDRLEPEPAVDQLADLVDHDGT